jgi:dienelactone hydrolase
VRATAVSVVVLLLLPAAVVAAPVAAVFAGRVPCVETAGVQFCEGGVAARVESFDGVPLDANVTLPPAAVDGPFPLVVDIHGWSLGKTPGPAVGRALEGYVVLSYSARGFHQSCGFADSRAPDPGLAEPDVCEERGWIRLADARYEARDTQHLAGLLADEGLVVPDRIGVTGASYGGGQSMTLAALRNRVMSPDGSLVPWRSPGGLDMAIAAAAPLIPWSDLAEALTPTGRTLDYREANPYGLRAGVQKESWVALLYGAGLASGFYAPPGRDPDADLTAWNARLAAGEPYDGDPSLRHALDEITRFHSAYYVDDSIPPAPLFIYNAWTDDLFPADEALRFWRKTRARHPGVEITLHFADAFGHPRAGLTGDMTRVSARVSEFFARHLKGTGAPLPAVEAYTQGCNGAAEAGPFKAADWDALHPGEVRLRVRRPKRFDGAGGSEANATALDPVSGGPCRTVPARDDPGAATWLLAPARGAGYTLLGAPTVVADLAVSGSYALVAARLWDVGPDRMQTLVSHALYRPRSDNRGPQVFQLHPNGWHFAAGHRPKLELLGRSAPYGRASRGDFTVTVANLDLRLPVRESPDGRVVRAPAARVLPPAEAEPPDSGPPACPAAPATGCRASDAGSLDVTPAHVVWRWLAGASSAKADLGDPRATTAYRACLYDGRPGLLWSAAVPAGACRGARSRGCWRAARGGFAYTARAGSGDGVTRLVLRPGAAGKGTIELHAGGGASGGPAAPLAGPLRVQLLAVGGCWETTLAAAP